jgi:hypothetical protein
MIHSVAGLLREGRLITRPPFREPHHSASQAALVGGGSRVKPGEISLAHHGVLFLDEWPEFPRPALEALRQPMETGRAVIARANAHVTYPARFQTIAAMNPCRCGHLGTPSRECARAPRCGEEYAEKISGPLLDRMDLCIEVQAVPAAELSRAPTGEASVAGRGAGAGGPRPAGRALWRGRAAPQRGGRGCRAGGEAGPGAGSAGAAGTGIGAAGTLGARPCADAARRPHHRRPRRAGERRAGACGGGAGLSAARPSGRVTSA